MERIAQLLTKYVISKGIAEERLYEIYKYGFQIGLEAILSVFISIFIAVQMQMIPEAMLFYLIFIPLRIYVGGLHLDKYFLCLVFSCLTLVVVLVATKHFQISCDYLLVISIIMLLFIKRFEPVEHVNRPVDEEEQNYFNKKLNVIVLADFLCLIIFYILKRRELLFLVAITLLLVAISMILGKIKYNRDIRKA